MFNISEGAACEKLLLPWEIVSLQGIERSSNSNPNQKALNSSNHLIPLPSRKLTSNM